MHAAAHAPDLALDLVRAQVVRLRDDNAALMETLVRTKVELAETQGARPTLARPPLCMVPPQSLLPAQAHTGAVRHSAPPRVFLGVPAEVVRTKVELAETQGAPPDLARARALHGAPPQSLLPAQAHTGAVRHSAHHAAGSEAADPIRRVVRLCHAACARTGVHARHAGGSHGMMQVPPGEWRAVVK
jgi:hypothetical protein